MTVREDAVEFSPGKNGIFGVVEKPDFALIVPFDEGQFTLIKQYRYPVEGSFWEFPQGSWESQPEVDTLSVAKAELEEETGFKAKSFQEIGFLYEAYGYCNQGFHVFLASQLEKGQQKLEDSEVDAEVKQCSVKEFEKMIEEGEIRDAPTISAYGLLKVKGIL